MFKKFLAFVLAFTIITAPNILLAGSVKMSGLVPVCNTKIGTDGTFTDPCGFEYFMTMINYVLEWVFKYLATPFFALVFVWAGWLYISDMGSSKNVSKAKDVMKYAVYGYLLILVSWLIVDTIMKGLGFTGENYLTKYN